MDHFDNRSANCSSFHHMELWVLVIGVGYLSPSLLIGFLVEETPPVNSLLLLVEQWLGRQNGSFA